ncbi:MAG: hypothetical protein E6R04_08125 [Spirochaetes bacterium]|nr:MAG: hypothetical protein E6R04_08125 [Spirochaetota bacterium]
MTKEQLLQKQIELMNLIKKISEAKAEVFTSCVSPGTGTRVCGFLSEASDAVRDELYLIELAIKLHK